MAFHGMSKTRFHRIWRALLARCNNPNQYNYKYYGARGVRVSDRWLTFLNFKEDMYDSYLNHVEEFGEKNTTIDRKNPSGDYTTENCRWATLLEQGRNKRKRVSQKVKPVKKVKPVNPVKRSKDRPEKISMHGRTYVQEVEENGKRIFIIVRRSDGVVLNRIGG